MGQTVTDLPESARWDEELRTRTIALPSEKLDQAVKFLEHARHNGAWGIYPGTEVDRHSSAVAVAALRTADEYWLIRDCTILFRKKYSDQVPGLGVDALLDVVELLKDAFHEEADLRKAVSRRSKELLKKLVHEPGSGGIPRLAGVLATATAAGILDSAAAAPGWKALIAAQNGDGSWSAVHGQSGSVVVTAAALSALNQGEHDGAVGIRQGAFEYLSARATAFEAGSGSPDLFELATTILAMASYRYCDYWLMSGLQDAILARQSQDDGGWAEQAGSPSTVEHTALAVLALTAAGARSHVPTRLAEAALTQARGELNEIGTERDRLVAGFDEAVQEHCGGLVAEVERLRGELARAQKSADEVAELEGQVRRLRRVAEPLTYSSELLADTPLRTREYVAVVMVWASGGVVLAIAAALAIGVVPRSTLALVLLVGASVVATIFALVAAESRRRRTQRFAYEMRGLAERSHLQWLPLGVEPGDDRLRSLRLSFNRVLDDCRPAVRQELVYLLFDGFIEVPADVAGRRAEQVGMRLGMSVDGVVRFKQWASAAALLEPKERQLLFDQIRRSVEL